MWTPKIIQESYEKKIQIKKSYKNLLKITSFLLVVVQTKQQLSQLQNDFIYSILLICPIDSLREIFLILSFSLFLICSILRLRAIGKVLKETKLLKKK